MMTSEELHQIGIKVVYKDLADNGYEVIGMRRELNANPQLVARKDGRFFLVVVKTAAYPDMGVLYPQVAAEVLEIAQKRQATCFFASVGVANANGETKEEMAEPLINGQHYIKYDGYKPFPVF